MVYALRALSNIEPTPFGDKYLLVEHIATGGMAEIYRAQYSGIEGFAKELVVKRLREEFAERDDVVGMFLDEARVAATLSHNNVVHTYDLGELGGEYFIAMELLKGEELIMLLRRSAQTGIQLPLEISLGIIMQSLEGLDYVHARSDEHGQPLGLVHRDINPTNIHVSYDGVCKIVDFGIAATRAKALEGAGRFAGKLSYMAPEQVLGENIDSRADLFALGVLLYEMCLRRRLFRGPADEVRRRILEGEIPAPTFVDPEFPPGLEAIIMKALEVDPADRYQNADHMFRDLDNFLQELGLSWTPRRISAYMAELFGEGAPAEVDYEDLYDDLESASLDFADFDRLGGEEGEQEPEWAKSVTAGKSPGKKKRRKAMTIGNLEALVADAGLSSGSNAGAPEESGVRRREDPNRASGHHKVVSADGDEADGADGAEAEDPRAASQSGPAPSKHKSTGSGPRTKSRPHTKSRPAIKTGSAPTVGDGMTGAFGQTVMTQQARRGNGAIIFLIVTVLLGVIGYVAWTVFTQK